MTTTDGRYVPDEEDVRTAYALEAARDTIGDTDYRAIPEARAEFDRFLTRVRREAAREALGRLADHSDSRDGEGVKGRLGKTIRVWRDAHYPEGDDQ